MATQPQAVPSRRDKPEQLSIFQVVSLAYRESDGNEDQVRARLLARVKRDDRLLTEALVVAIDILLGSHLGNQRNSRLRAASREDRGLKDSGLAARGTSNLHSLMAYPMPRTYQRLGDCTREEVHEAYMFHRSCRVGHGLRERWFLLVYKALKDPKLPVKRQLGEDDLQHLERRAKKDEDER